MDNDYEQLDEREPFILLDDKEKQAHINKIKPLAEVRKELWIVEENPPLHFREAGSVHRVRNQKKAKSQTTSYKAFRLPKNLSYADIRQLFLNAGYSFSEPKAILFSVEDDNEGFFIVRERIKAVEFIKESGVNIVIAKSFARIFYRNAINIGLIPIESAEIFEKVSKGDLILVNTDEGIVNLSTGEEVSIDKPSQYQLNILNHGGLVNYIKNRMSNPEEIVNEI